MIAPELVDFIMSSQGKRAAQFTAMHQLIESGYSGRQALEWLRGFTTLDAPGGLGMRTQTFYEYWTPMVDMSNKAGLGVRVQPGHYPGAGTMTDTPFQQVRKYNYFVNVMGTDTETGVERARVITIASDVQLTRGEIEQEAGKVLQSDVERYGFTGEIGATYSHGSRRPGRV